MKTSSVRCWMPYAPGLEMQYDSGDESLLNKTAIDEQGFKRYEVTSRILDDTGQGHELVETTFTEVEPVFLGGRQWGCLRLSGCWKTGSPVESVGDSCSIVRGKILSIDPKTKIGTIKVILIDSVRLEDLRIECILQESVEIKSVFNETATSIAGWKQ